MKKFEGKNFANHKEFINDCVYLGSYFDYYAKRGTEFLSELHESHETYMDWIKVCRENTGNPDRMIIMDLTLAGIDLARMGKNIDEIINFLQNLYCTDQDAIKEEMSKAIDLINQFWFKAETKENNKTKRLA